MALQKLDDKLDALRSHIRKLGNKRKPTTDLYRSLDEPHQEIRLLVVEPGTGNERVQCTFRYVHLGALVKPVYETVSYVWGDASIRATVRLEGQRISVPASSERVLRRFRYTDRQRILWIDPLCINQADIEERSKQVAMMDQVYGNTTHNLIWLGEDHHTTPHAIECIHNVANDMKAETKGVDASGLLFDSTGNTRYSSHGLSYTLSENDVEDILQYYSSEWFQRLWVFQEAALADCSTCYCGKTECSLNTVVEAARWLRHKTFHVSPRFVPSESPGMDSASRLFDFCDRSIGVYRAQQGFGLDSILSDPSPLSCSAARDHVYAVLGLVRKFTNWKSNSHLILPDYNKPVVDVFSDAAMYCILQMGNLSILSWGAPVIEQSGTPGLPTWVPHWHTTHDHHKDSTDLRPSIYRACGAKRLNIAHTQQSCANQLNVTGIVVDEVEKVSVVINEKIFVNLFDETVHTQAVCQLFGMNDTFLSLPISHHEGMLPFAVTAGVDHQQERWRDGECARWCAAHDREIRNINIDALRDLTSASTLDERLASNFRQAMILALLNRCFFVTSSGRLGLGPQTMESGDIVAILFGCKTPVILRRVQSDDRLFEFVGDSYIYGIMDGEAVEEHEAAGREDAEFILV